MRSIWKGTISFGLVNIPIALGVATQRSDPKFRTLDAETNQPIRQQMVSSARDDAVVERTETVKGYEVGKGQFVVVSDEELESVAVERRRTIDIVSFIDIDEVDPVYYDRTYYVVPQETANKPYTLLLEALKQTGKAAVGKIVLSSKEHLVLLRPSGDTLAIELLFYPEDVRPEGRDRGHRPRHEGREGRARHGEAARREPVAPVRPGRVRERAQARPDGADREEARRRGDRGRARARGAPARAGPHGGAPGLARPGEGREAQGRREAAAKKKKAAANGSAAKKTKSRARAKTKA